VVLLKKYRLLKKEIAKGVKPSYEAVISKIKPFGISFFVSEFFIEGFIHISEIGDEYFYFNEDTQSFEGQKTKKRYAVGTAILVTPIHIDLVFLESTWIMAKTKKSRK
jgi:ribonuclease R